MLQRVLAEPGWLERMTTDDHRGLTPSIYAHINPYGRLDVDSADELTSSNAWRRKNGKDSLCQFRKNPGRKPPEIQRIAQKRSAAAAGPAWHGGVHGWSYRQATG